MELQDFIEMALNRTQEALMEATDGLTYDELTWRPRPDANSVGFIFWHQVRAEDMFVQARFQRKPQVWESERWYEKMNLPADPIDIGFRYSAEQIASFPVPQLQDLVVYGNGVRARTLEFVRGLSPDKLDEPVEHPRYGDMSTGRMLSRLVCELAFHVGQIAYLRGMMRGLDK